MLITEDDPVMRHTLRKALEELSDVEVIGEAGNGLEAIRLVKEIQPWGRKTCKIVLNNTKESITMTKARARELEKKLGVNLTK